MCMYVSNNINTKFVGLDICDRQVSFMCASQIF
jgi:hypothetical protein